MGIRTCATIALCLMPAFLFPACSSESSASIQRSGELGETQIAKAASTGKPASVQVFAKRDGTGTTIRPRLDIQAPFRIEATLGAYDGKGTDWGPDGSIGISVIDSSFLTSAFGAVGVKRDGTGLSAAAEAGGGKAFTPQSFDTLAVDVAIEHDGTQMIFFARTRGAVAFEELGRTAQAFKGPYHVSLDVGSLRRGARAGIDDLLLVNSADPTDLTTPERRAKAAIVRAAQAMLAAQRAADSRAPDANAASTALGTARDRLDDASAELAAVGKPGKKARASLGAVRRAVVSALSKLDHGTPPRKTTPLFRKMTSNFAKAVVRLP